LGYIAYFECNIDYIVEKYCVNKEKPELKCNGKCHLAKKINLDIPSSKDDTKELGTVSEAFFPVFKEKNFKYTLKNILQLNTKDYWKRQFLSPTNIVNPLEQPPDFHS
jgi:hypothetical protein